MDEFALEFLEPDAQQMIKEMLAAIVSLPEVHQNVIMVRHSKGRPTEFEYYLGVKSGAGASPVKRPYFLRENILEQLDYHGFLVPDPLNRGSGQRSFSDAALAWQQQFGGPSADEVRRRIGRYLHRHVGKPVPPFYSVEEVSAAIGIPPEPVHRETHMLLGAGLFHQKLSNDSEFGALALTEPEGVRWAASNFPAIGALGISSVAVAIGLQVDVRSVIEQARAADVDPVLLEQFEARLRRLEEELEKPEGEGNFEKVKDVVETANTSREFLESVIPFLFKHWDKIQTLADAAGNALT